MRGTRGPFNSVVRDKSFRVNRDCDWMVAVAEVILAQNVIGGVTVREEDSRLSWFDSRNL
jgi:hypothetical protein